MLHLLAQTTQPAPDVPMIFTKAKMLAALAGALAFGVIAFYHDLNQYLVAPAGASWDWKKTIARVGVGVIGGAAVGFGINIAAISAMMTWT